MSNPVFDLLGKQAPMPGNMGQIMSQFQQFRQAFKGDPKEQVQQLLNSGKVSQAQYNQAVQMANALQRMLK